MPTLDTNAMKSRAQGMLSGFSMGQRAVVLIAVVVLVGGGILFTQWAAKPSMTPLFSNLSSADAASMTTALQKKNVSFKLTDGGATILVPQNQVYQLRLDMAGAGLTSGDSQGYKLLDTNSSITQSEFSQHTTYQRALEGELTKTIESINGVKSANVHLVIPQQDVFSSDSVKPTASVLITSAQGKTMSAQAVQSIVNLVATSVQGLSAGDVTVADSTGKLLSAQGTVGGDGTDQQNQQTASLENDLNSKITTLLTPLVGQGKAVVQTRAELNWDKSTTQSEQWNPTNKSEAVASQNVQTETYGNGVGGAAATGCIGTQTPVNGVCTPAQGTTTGSSTANTAYGTNHTTTDYKPDHQITNTETAVGQPKRVTVAVVLDSNAGNVDENQIKQLVSDAAGLQPARGDNVTVSRIAFNQDAANSQSQAAKDAAKAAKTDQMMGFIKIGATVLIVLVVLAILFITTKRRAKLYVTTPVSMAELDAAMPFTNGDDLLDAIEAQPVVVDTSPEALERAKVDREITDLIEKQPEEVAYLLRGWLADRRN